LIYAIFHNVILLHNQQSPKIRLLFYTIHTITVNKCLGLKCLILDKPEIPIEDKT